MARSRIVQLAAAAAVVVLLAGCSSASTNSQDAGVSTPSVGASNPTSSTAAPNGSDTPSPTDAETAEPGGVVCKLTSSTGGSFYVQIISNADHNFTVCDGGTRLPFNTHIFGLDPTMDGRCVNDDTIATDRAQILVFSSSTPADLTAAQTLCASHGWKPRAN